MAVKEESEGLLTPFMFLGVYLILGVLCCWLAYGLGREHEEFRSEKECQGIRDLYLDDSARIHKSWKAEIVNQGFGSWKVQDGEIVFVWAKSDNN